MKQSFAERFSYWAEAATDLVLLNLLWLFCCLPIFTIGASTTAMHYVVRKMVAGEPYKVWRGFWHSLKANWKQATGSWLLILVLGAFCAADFYIGGQIVGTMGSICQIVGVIGMLLTACVMTFLFPILARYNQPFTLLWKNALLLSLMNPHIVIAGCAAAFLFPGIVLWNNQLIAIATPAWILVGGALAALVVQILLKKVFSKLEVSIPTEE